MMLKRDENSEVRGKKSSLRKRLSLIVEKEKQLVDVGDVAPDFELVDSEGIKHKLSDFRGRRVLLSFFRFAS